ncbi:C40 family peptidase [Kineococcus sp. TBRC 1896]|uniref:C40 family peptidase n=1 Tax=Kineococcus mangrovi TaxID=1660183 RepID=A0ABV4I3Q6_9ACTN
MTTRVQARHRAAVRPLTPLTDLSGSLARTAGGAARTGAVAAAAGGLLAAVALPASAAPAAAPAAVGASTASAVPAAFGATAPGVVSAPATATTLATTATFAAAPAPAPVVVAPVLERGTRTAGPAPAIASSVAESAVALARPAAVEVAAPAPAPAPEPAPAPVPLGQQILSIADDYAGAPYVYGGTTPSGFDCSGYTSYVYRQVGVDIPRTANAQKQAAAGISRGDAVPGDLVFFSNSGGRAYHVGIYAGDNMMWDAPRAGKPVQLRAIWSSAVTFGRLAPTV